MRWTRTSIRPRQCRWSDRLIKANKDFDLLLVPGGGHGAGGRYGERKLMDFFVRNLEGLQTPDWNRQGTENRAPPQSY